MLGRPAGLVLAAIDRTDVVAGAKISERQANRMIAGALLDHVTEAGIPFVQYDRSYDESILLVNNSSVS